MADHMPSRPYGDDIDHRRHAESAASLPHQQSVPSLAVQRPQQHANYARPLTQRPFESAYTNGLRPPANLGVNRGSVTSIYSQASTVERPGSFGAASNPRKYSPRPPQVGSPELTSVDEEDTVAAVRPYNASTASSGRSGGGSTLSTLTIIPRPATPDEDDKPLVSPITRSNSQWSRSAVSPEQSIRHTTTYHSDAITALSAAINSSIQDPATPPKLPSTTYSAARMPFEDSPESKATLEDALSIHSQADRDRLVTVPLYEHHRAADYPDPRPKPFGDLRSASTQSTNPLLESPIEKSISPLRDEATPHGRPRLIAVASQQAESRSSLTSLPDLIRRATRVASNLDRGRTASRLGLDMMFSNSSDRASVKKRNSTYSDVLFSFPAPGSSRPASAAQEHRSPEWQEHDKAKERATSRLMEVRDEGREDEEEEADEKQAAMLTSKTKSRKKRRRSKGKRRCCGLPVAIFVMLCIAVIILIIAAVLLPVLLVWSPRHKAAKNNPLNCPTVLPCHNTGISIVDNNACSCICVGGFTGNQCGISRDPSCITTTFVDGVATYGNATIGNNIMPLLATTAPSFNLPLNSTIIMSVFSHNNLSCSAENSLVHFSVSASARKRLVMITDLEPVVTSGIAGAISVVDENVVVKRRPVSDKTSNIIRAADDEPPPAETVNNIVFQVSSTSDPVPSATSTLSNAIATASGSPAPATSTPSVKLTSDQIEFAQMVVLYVLQEVRIPNIAVNSQQILEQYLRAGGPGSGNVTVDVVNPSTGYQKMTADFEKFSITMNDNSIVGGSRTAN